MYIGQREGSRRKEGAQRDENSRSRGREAVLAQREDAERKEGGQGDKNSRSRGRGVENGSLVADVGSKPRRRRDRDGLQEALCNPKLHRHDHSGLIIGCMCSFIVSCHLLPPCSVLGTTRTASLGLLKNCDCSVGRALSSLTKQGSMTVLSLVRMFKPSLFANPLSGSPEGVRKYNPALERWPVRSAHGIKVAVEPTNLTNPFFKQQNCQTKQSQRAETPISAQRKHAASRSLRVRHAQADRQKDACTHF